MLAGYLVLAVPMFVAAPNPVAAAYHRAVAPNLVVVVASRLAVVPTRAVGAYFRPVWLRSSDKTWFQG